MHLQSAELFTLTYGAIVMQLIKDFDSVDEVNTQLEKMYMPPPLRFLSSHA
jgi:hypothetical protein